MARSQSLFASAKIGVENVVGVTVDAVVLVRAELKHTARLNTLENDLEYDDAVVSALSDVLNELAKIPKDAMTDADKFKQEVLTKRLNKLQALVWFGIMN